MRETAAFGSILVALDGSDAAGGALEEAIKLAARARARLTLISVAVPPRRVGWPYFMPYPTDDELAQDAQEIVERAAALVPEDVPVSTVVRIGPAAQAILERVEQAEHDLIALGSRGLGTTGSLLLGSVSRAVLAKSGAPVLVYPAHAGEGQRVAPPASGATKAAS